MESGGALYGLSQRGALTIETLHLNRPQLVRHRLLEQREKQAQVESQETRRLIESLEQRLRRVEKLLQKRKR